VGNFLTVHANEQSTFVVTVAFKDEEGNDVTPTSMNWTLTDSDGNVINNRENVVVNSPSSSEDIVLSGDDLAVTDENNRVRILTVEAVYSSSLGSNLPLKDDVTFTVDNLIAVS